MSWQDLTQDEERVLSAYRSTRDDTIEPWRLELLFVAVPISRELLAELNREQLQRNAAEAVMDALTVELLLR